MASGNGGRFVRGSFIASGAEKVIRTPERPLRVELINTTDPAHGIHHDHMPDGSIYVNTDVHAFVTANGVTLSDTGFTVGTDANFNTDGEQIYWTAWF